MDSAFKLEHGLDKDNIDSIVTEMVNATLELPTEDFYELMYGHLRLLRLVNADNEWQHESLLAIADKIIPETIDETYIIEFMNEIGRSLRANPYMMNILKEKGDRVFTTTKKNIEKEGQQVFPDVIAYGIVLNNLVGAMRDDWRVIEACRNIWDESFRKDKLRSFMNLFEKAKFLSIDWPIKKFIEFGRTGKVKRNFFKLMLPINILEAVAFDFLEGLKNNAKCGVSLMRRLPNSPNKETNSSAFWSPDRKAVIINVPKALHWTRLYQVWNLAFVSRYGPWPYLAMKLLVPNIGSFEAKPKEYIYNRILGLFSHLYFVFLERHHNKVTGDRYIEWHDPELQEFLGDCNWASTQDFEKQMLKNRQPKKSKNVKTAK